MNCKRAPLLRRLLVGLALLTATGVAAEGAIPAAAETNVEVTAIVDGDTFDTSVGRVRLLQVDTPETHGEDECYGEQASMALARLLPVGSSIRLAADPALDRVDRYGRKLRYVFRNDNFVQLALIRQGAAAPYFFHSERGRYSRRLLRAAKHAKRARKGAWGACPRATLTPESSWSTGAINSSSPITPTPSPGGTCAGHPYPCAPAYPPDIDCSDLPGPVWVGGSDPHHLDGDHDGIGCEG